ncbi:hypothetical protein DV738_g2187, partial [Chaetothyriales sp. CBS 135597]
MHEPLSPLLLSGFGSPTAGSSPLLLSRNESHSRSQSLSEDWETPLDRLTLFDFFDNIALNARIEKWQQALSEQRQKFKKRRTDAKDRAIQEWRKRVPSSDEQLRKYRSRMKRSVDQLGKRWNDTVTISAKEKISFISAVLNVFISGYLIGGLPEYFYIWFTVQLVYFMPIRLVTYHKRGMHYFLADLCYFVNALTLLSIWAFPQSKRLFMGTYCLSYGNNAIAIVMWRNSLVFHSLDKVTSLFIHVMPPVTWHCIVHLTPAEMLRTRFPAVYQIKYSGDGEPGNYTLLSMLGFATAFYFVWQISYHFLISVRKREKIAAGRPTSFTWLRRSYSKTWIGRFVLSLPDALQEPAFMMIQYVYAVFTILPCPLWFHSQRASAAFLIVVFTWSIWNGANYYMDVFGKRFQKELEQMKAEVAKWQNTPGSGGAADEGSGGQNLILTPPAIPIDSAVDEEPVVSKSVDVRGHKATLSLDEAKSVSTSTSEGGVSTGLQVHDDDALQGANGTVVERRV